MLSLNFSGNIIFDSRKRDKDQGKEVGEKIDEHYYLKRACEQFLGKNIHEIKDTLQQTLEGHLRAILGTMTVEEIYKDRNRFAKEVSEKFLVLLK